MQPSLEILIKGARIIDPASRLDKHGDILMREGKIIACGDVIDTASLSTSHDVIDATGLIACPGFIDLHCHLRDPGFEYKETIASGTRAAAKGGFTTVCCMPNTEPAIDNAAVVEYIIRRAKEDGVVRVFPIGCVSKGRKGIELSEMEELAVSGVVGFSDDGDPVWDANLMRLALMYSVDLGLPISDHCQDHALSQGGVMAEGAVSTRLGLVGIPAAAEESMVARDISLAELTGGKLHLAHLSTAGSVELVRRAKDRGIAITAEVCPHHLLITEQRVMGKGVFSDANVNSYGYDTSTKVYPPLRTNEDMESLRIALADGVIDCVATDHAPHDIASKEVTYQEAAFGISVLETAFGSLMQLVDSGSISITSLVERLTVGPARVLGPKFEQFSSLAVDTPADIVLFDPVQEWVVDTASFESKGRNTPLEGADLRGQIIKTFVDGRMIYDNRAIRIEES